MRPVSLYVHVPFCRRRCPYCTFFHVPHTDRRVEERYVRSLAAELDATSATMPDGLGFATVYVGGGTPSVLERRSLETIVAMFEPRLAPGDVEVTVEVNPEDVNGGMLDMFADLGFNRISAGVQSMSDPGQRMLGRCEPDVNRRALRQINERFTNFNVDLLLGIPGGTRQMLSDTIDGIDEFDPPHLSVYCLETGGAVEPSSKRFFEGVDQERAADEYLFVCRALASRGYRHYEVSNFARPGFECRHNLVYWSGGEYLGIGPGAHSFLAGERFSNAASIDAYVDSGAKRRGAVRRIDSRDKGQRRLETVMLGLRTANGLPLDQMDAGGRIIDDLVEAGLARVDGGRLVLSDRGFLVLNEIVHRLCDRQQGTRSDREGGLTGRKSKDRLFEGF